MHALAPPPDYCAQWCEENIWRLLDHPACRELAREVWLISNPSRQVVMWGQRASEDPETPVLWDYHVVLRVEPDDGSHEIWDLDHRAGLRSPLADWLSRSWGPDPLRVPPPYRPWFRRFRATDYRANFASDRSHMRDAQGEWMASPPAWPAIGVPEKPGDTLARWLAFDEAQPPWTPLHALLAEFSP